MEYQHTQNVSMTSPYSQGLGIILVDHSVYLLMDALHRIFFFTLTFAVFPTLPHYPTLTLPSPTPSPPPSPVPFLFTTFALVPNFTLFPAFPLLLSTGSHVRGVRLYPRSDPPRSQAEGREIPPEVQSEGAKLYEEDVT